MLELYDVTYEKLTSAEMHDLFSLRCGVFKTRLNWNVSVRKSLESDEYDNRSASYIFGKVGNKLVCGVRFIDSKNKTMISGVFQKNFKKLNLPEGDYLEASRLFVDKVTTQNLNINNQPVSTLLLLSMINYSKSNGYSSIYAVVSIEVFLIFKRTGWMIEVVSEGVSEQSEKILFIYMPVDDKNQSIVIEKIKSCSKYKFNNLDSWPILWHV